MFGQTWEFVGLLGGSSKDLVQWFGSPPFLSHKVRPFGTGRHPILRGLIITMVINHISKSWDDPPRGMGSGGVWYFSSTNPAVEFPTTLTTQDAGSRWS